MTIIKREKVDNNSKSDRRICELWRLSRTTASSAAIMCSKKENKEIEVEERGVLRPETIQANSCIAEFRAEHANSLEWETWKNALRTMRNFSHFVPLFRVLVLSLYRCMSNRRHIRDSIPRGKKRPATNELYLLYFLICVVGFMRLEKRKVCHTRHFLYRCNSSQFALKS